MSRGVARPCTSECEHEREGGSKGVWPARCENNVSFAIRVSRGGGNGRA